MLPAHDFRVLHPYKSIIVDGVQNKRRNFKFADQLPVAYTYFISNSTQTRRQRSCTRELLFDFSNSLMRNFMSLCPSFVR